MFLETICINKSVVQNIDVHIRRMVATASHYNMQAPELPDLVSLMPIELHDKLVRCSITYNTDIINIAFYDYTPRNIKSLKLVESDIDYSHKFADRESLNSLLQYKDDCDEVLIVKGGMITDTTFSNIVFSNKDGLFTPQSYLLNGTKRQQLLDNHSISEAVISPDDLHKYDKAYLINAMLNIGDIELDVKDII